MPRYDNSDFDEPQNVLDKDAEFAAAGTDRTHIFNASYVYELPFGREATQGWRKGLLGRVAASRDYQGGIRSDGSNSGRQLQFRWLVHQ